LYKTLFFFFPLSSLTSSPPPHIFQLRCFQIEGSGVAGSGSDIF
jgi:hypothetical protein